MIQAVEKTSCIDLSNQSTLCSRSLMGILVALHIVVFSTAAIRIYRTYNAAGDLTVYGQTFWNSINGRPFQTTYNWSVHAFWSLVGDNEVLTIPADASGMGVHFEPGMALFWPVFRLWPQPETLLTIQSVALGLAAWPVYLLARRKLRSELAGLIAGAAFLLSPALAGINLVNFHAQAFLVLWIGVTFFFLEEGNDRWFAACYFLALVTNEIASVTLTMIGLYALVVKKRHWLGILACVIPPIYFLVVTNVVIPRFSLYGHYMFTGYFSRWGGSPVELIRGFISSPESVIGFLTGREQINYLLALFAPVLFLPVAGLEVLLLASPVILANLLANSSSQRLMWGHYSASVLPLLYCAAIWGAARLEAWARNHSVWPYRGSTRRLMPWLAAPIIALLLLMNARFSLWPVTDRLKWDSYQPPPNVETLQRAMALIPGAAAVSTVDSISTQMANRREIYLFPVYADRVDYVIVPRRDRIWPLTQEQHDGYLNRLVIEGHDQIIFDEGGYVVLRRVDTR